MRTAFPRSNLRLSDLREKSRHPPHKLLNVKIPDEVNQGIDRICRELGASKTQVVIALFNEGLDAAAELFQGWKPPTPPAGRKRRLVRRPLRLCSVPGCGQTHMAKGYCGKHYLAAKQSPLT